MVRINVPHNDQQDLLLLIHWSPHVFDYDAFCFLKAQIDPMEVIQGASHQHMLDFISSDGQPIFSDSLLSSGNDIALRKKRSFQDSRLSWYDPAF